MQAPAAMLSVPAMVKSTFPVASVSATTLKGTGVSIATRLVAPAMAISRLLIEPITASLAVAMVSATTLLPRAHVRLAGAVRAASIQTVWVIPTASVVATATLP